ncbi:MAG: nitroreductase family protein [Myxococcota bacterium]|jgi:nitroreductase
MPSKTLALTPDELLTTTRAVRKRLDFDRPVELSAIRECLEIALQAPSGSNAQGWQWVVVTDAAKRKQLADIYRKAWAIYENAPFAADKLHADDPSMKPVQERVFSSAKFLAENIHRAPVLLVPCMVGRVEAGGAIGQASSYGSILPAVWSFMLAARARGLGTAWTSMHLMFEQESAKVLGIPYEQVTQTALIPVAYTKGTEFKAAPRKPLDPVVHLNGW